MNREKKMKERYRILDTISGIEAICGSNIAWQECQHCVALEMFEKSEALEEELQAEREKQQHSFDAGYKIASSEARGALNAERKKVALLREENEKLKTSLRINRDFLMDLRKELEGKE